MWIRTTGVALVLGVLTGGPGTAWAGPPIDEVLGPATVLPPRAERVPLVPLPPLPKAEAGLDPAKLAQDPVMFARFIEADPSRLNVATMEPAVALTLAQILLRGDRTFLAEKLLWDAHTRWPDRADLLRAHARVLISLGRPQAAVDAVAGAVERWPGDPSLRYLHARGLLALQRSPVNAAAAARALEAVLEIDPNYVDPEGVTADEIRQVLAQLRGQGTAPR